MKYFVYPQKIGILATSKCYHQNLASATLAALRSPKGKMTKFLAPLLVSLVQLLVQQWILITLVMKRLKVACKWLAHVYQC